MTKRHVEIAVVTVFYLGLIWFLLNCSNNNKPEITSESDILVCEQKLEETRKDYWELASKQFACNPSACQDKVREWANSREYPCSLLRQDYTELQAQYDMKCPQYNGELLDCEANLRDARSEMGTVRAALNECRGEELPPTVCKTKQCKERHL